METPVALRGVAAGLLSASCSMQKHGIHKITWNGTRRHVLSRIAPADAVIEPVAVDLIARRVGARCTRRLVH